MSCSGYLDLQKAKSEDCGTCVNLETCPLKLDGCRGEYYKKKEKEVEK